MNYTSIINFTKRYNKSDVTQYCRKYNPEFKGHEQYMLNLNDLPALVVVDDYPHVKVEI